MTTRFRDERACLDCGARVDASTRANPFERDKRPKRGDIAICLDCGHVMIYADRKGSLRALTDEELVEIAGHPEVVRANNAIAAMRRRA